MTGAWSEQKAKLAAAWNRFVTVDVPDEEEARLGRLFCVVMVLTFGLSLVLALILVSAVVRGLFPIRWQGWLIVAFSLLFLPISAFSYRGAKQGNVSSVSQTFVWLTFILIALVILFFGGTNSPAWLLFFWPVTLAGLFLRPLSGIRMAFAVLLYHGFLTILWRYVFTTPPSGLSIELFSFLTRAFGLLMLVGAAGFVNYLSTNSVRQSLDRMRLIGQDLRGTQRLLERRVAERTAELEKRARQFRTIAELNRALSSIVDLRSLLDTAVRMIAERLNYDHVGLFLIDPNNQWAVLQAASSEGGQRMLARGHRLRVGQQGLVGYVAQTGLPRIAFSVGEDAVWFNNPDLPDTQSEMSLPLIVRGQTVIGVLDIQTNKPAAFTENDVEMLRILADNIAIAVVNTQSIAETNAALARLERYQEQDALRAWRQALTRRRMRVSYAFDSGFVNPTDVTTGPDLGDDVLTEVTTRVTASGKHVLLAPIRIKNYNVGILSFEKSTPWAADQIQLAQSVIEQLDLALDNARLLEETRLRAQQERARSDIVGRIRAMTSTDAILRNAARELGMALQVERSRIQLLPPAESRREERP